MATDSPKSTRTKTKEPSKWATRWPGSPDAMSERRRKLWQALHEFIRDNGGWVVSPPGADLRIEIPERSELPAKLTELGYRPLSIGQATRLTNKPGAPSPWVILDIIIISLPRQ
jgi:hypothetical protein